MAESASIDWPGLATQLGSIGAESDGTRTERGGASVARAALELLLTRREVVGAVDHYVSLMPGFELARSVLWLLRPWSAMLRCRELFSTPGDLQVRRSTVELLRVVADRRVVPWVPTFLADPDLGIQSWGIGVLDQLVFSGLADAEEVRPLIELALTHENESDRRVARDIEERLEARDSRSATIAEASTVGSAPSACSDASSRSSRRS